MDTSVLPPRQAGAYRYVEEGPATALPPVVLLHGMLGDVGNWTDTARALGRQGYRVLVPLLPVYDLPLKETSVPGLVAYVRGFAEALGLGRIVLAGNSLGGQVATLYTLAYPADVAALVLSGSSGIYEVEMGTSTPRRQDRNYIRERAALTFYDPVHATDALVEEMHELVNDRARVTRLIKMARSTKAESIADRLSDVRVPVLLVWGRNDLITPPDVAEAFRARLPHAVLHFIDRCGHAPMIEHPAVFNRHLLDFLAATFGPPLAARPHRATRPVHGDGM